VPAAWPTSVVVQIVDNCGQPMVAGSVSAGFSNGDPPISLVSLKDGQWSGTWQARNTSAGTISITVAAESGLPPIRGSAQLTGSLGLNPDVPQVAPGAIVSAASFASNAPLAPGSLISIFGKRLADRSSQASAFPLNIDLSGTSVVIAGQLMPLLFASDG